MATTETLLTAEEYAQLPENGQPTELVRGRVVAMNVPFPRHGEICTNVILAFAEYRRRGLGRIIGNDAGVITERDPDSVRGPDVAFYSYERVPPGPLPRRGYLAVAPDLVFEIRSPTDRWKDLLAKVVEFLEAGVRAVCVIDPGVPIAFIYRPDQPDQHVRLGEAVRFPEILGDLSATLDDLLQ